MNDKSCRWIRVGLNIDFLLFQFYGYAQKIEMLFWVYGIGANMGQKAKKAGSTKNRKRTCCKLAEWKGTDRGRALVDPKIVNLIGAGQLKQSGLERMIINQLSCLETGVWQQLNNPNRLA